MKSLLFMFIITHKQLILLTYSMKQEMNIKDLIDNPFLDPKVYEPLIQFEDLNESETQTTNKQHKTKSRCGNRTLQLNQDVTFKRKPQIYKPKTEEQLAKARERDKKKREGMSKEERKLFLERKKKANKRYKESKKLQDKSYFSKKNRDYRVRSRLANQNPEEKEKYIKKRGRARRQDILNQSQTQLKLQVD